MINDKKLVYLAAPYSHEDIKVRNKRVKTIAKVAGKLIKDKDVYVFSPITHGHPINQSVKEAIGYDYWLTFDKAMLDMCDEMWITDLEDWEKSRGIAEEINHCNTNGKTIRMVTKRGKVYPYVV